MDFGQSGLPNASLLAESHVLPRLLRHGSEHAAADVLLQPSRAGIPLPEPFAELYQIKALGAYCRVHLRDRGVVPLSHATEPAKSAASRVVSAVTALCDAVKPTDYAARISNLTRLRDSSTDPGLRQSVEEAIAAINADHVKAK